MLRKLFCLILIILTVQPAQLCQSLFGRELLSPSSMQSVKGSPFEAAEWANLETTFQFLKEEAPLYGLELPDSFFQGNAGILSQSDLYLPKGKNIFCLSHLEPALPLLLAGKEKANFLILPQSLENIFTENGKVFCTYGIVLNKERKLVYGKFDPPLQLHAGFHSDPESPELEQTNFPLVNHSEIYRLTKDKVAFKKLLDEKGLPTPEWMWLSGEDFREKPENEIKNKIHAFVRSLKNGSFVIKPSDRLQSIGVRLFSNFVDPTEYLEKIFASSEAAIVEKRVEPFEVFDEFEIQLDFNIRVLMTLDETGEPEVMGMMVRTAPKTEAPVSLAMGAEYYEFDSFFDVFEIKKTYLEQFLYKIFSIIADKLDSLLQFLELKYKIDLPFIRSIQNFWLSRQPNTGKQKRLTPSEIDRLKEKIIKLSVRTVKSIRQKTEHSKQSLSGGYFGLDLMINPQLEPAIIEANSGCVAGLKLLMHEQNGNLKLVQPFADYLLALSKKETTPLKKGKKYIASQRGKAWLFLGNALVENKTLDQAEIALKNALDLIPENPMVHTWLGILYSIKEDLFSAEAAFKQAYLLDPLNTGIIVYLANCLWENEKFSESLALLINAVTSSPDNKYLTHILGEKYIKIKYWGKALQIYEHLKNIDPLNPLTWYNLGVVYKNKPDSLKFMAARYFQRALQADPGFEPAAVELKLMLKPKLADKYKKFYETSALSPNSKVTLTNETDYPKPAYFPDLKHSDVHNAIAINPALYEEVKSSFPTFREYVDLALFHPEFGFYNKKIGIGMGQDFSTYPEWLSPYFGMLLAEHAFRMWRFMLQKGLVGPSETFNLYEFGGGNGTVARDLIAHVRNRAAENEHDSSLWKKFSRNLKYTVFERSPKLHRLQAEKNPYYLNQFESVLVDARSFEKKVSERRGKGLVFSNELIDVFAPEKLLFRKSGEILTAYSIPSVKKNGLEQILTLLDETNIKDKIESADSTLRNIFHFTNGEVYFLNQAVFTQLMKEIHSLNDLESIRACLQHFTFFETFLPIDQEEELQSNLIKNSEQISYGLALLKEEGQDVIIYYRPDMANFMKQTGELLESGFVITIDYGVSTFNLFELALMGEPGLVTYADDPLHNHAEDNGKTLTDPYRYPSLIDITSHIDFTHLAQAGISESIVPIHFGFQNDLENALGYLLKELELSFIPKNVDNWFNMIKKFRESDTFKVLVQQKLPESLSYPFSEEPMEAVPLFAEDSDFKPGFREKVFQSRLQIDTEFRKLVEKKTEDNRRALYNLIVELPSLNGKLSFDAFSGRLADIDFTAVEGFPRLDALARMLTQSNGSSDSAETFVLSHLFIGLVQGKYLLSEVNKLFAFDWESLRFIAKNNRTHFINESIQTAI